MTVHVLVEGASEHTLFEKWAPRVLRQHDIRVHPHQGKGGLPKNLLAKPDPKRRGLLDQLPAKLRAFAAALDSQKDAVIVVVDVDDDDISELDSTISNIAKQIAKDLTVLICLAVEETEAFYLGDLKALKKAFPDADMRLARKYLPDSICGTWELFGRIVRDGGGNKVAWANAMAPVLTTTAGRSRSPSFKKLLSALKTLPTASAPSRRSRKGYRHPVRNSADPGRRRQIR